MRKIAHLTSILFMLVLSLQSYAVTPPKPARPSITPQPPAGSISTLKEITWDDLMPPPDPVIVQRYQAGKMKDDEVLAYLDKLGLKTVGKINKTYGKIPGYLVPLNMNKDQIATELLLVPTLGACIHVPPPPPNQIVYISYPKGLKVTEAAYTPYWVVGTISVEKKASEYSDALYTMRVENITEYN